MVGAPDSVAGVMTGPLVVMAVHSAANLGRFRLIVAVAVSAAGPATGTSNVPAAACS